MLQLPSSSFRTDFSQGSNGDLDQRSPRSLDMWIELDAFLFHKPTPVNINYASIQMNFIRELLSFDMFLSTSQTIRATGNHWTHHSTFSHYHSRPPESSAGVIHIRTHLTDQFKNMKAHTIQHSNQIIEAIQIFITTFYYI